MESLAAAASLSPGHVRNKLHALPTTLEATYDEVMQRITSQDSDQKDIAIKALAWVSHAFRPLAPMELQHALSIQPGDHELDEDFVVDIGSITSLCAGLVIIDSTTNAVNLVHYTASKYFEDKRQIYFPGFHGDITMICAAYLNLPAVQNASIWAIVEKYPLACYAAEFIGDHARHNPEETLQSATLEAVCQLLGNSERRRSLLSLLAGLDLIKAGIKADADIKGTRDSVADNLDIAVKGDQHIVRRTNSDKMSEVTALHLAASMGLAKVASIILEESTDIDAVDETGKTALAVGMDRGFEKAVEILITSGASVDLTDHHGQQVFLLLVEKGWHNAADLVAQKAKDNSANMETNPFVMFVVTTYFGDLQEVRQLASLNTNGPKTDYYQAFALFVAVEHVDGDMVKLLLSLSVPVDSKDSFGQGSLHRATRKGSTEIMKILILHGAQVDLMDDQWQTPWTANVRSQETHVLKMLLAAGADPNASGPEGITVLYGLAASGESDKVKYVLDSGADPSRCTLYKWSPLHWAAHHGHTKCVKLLLSAGAHVNQRSDQMLTPLDLATQHKRHNVISILRKAGADGSTERDAKSNTTTAVIKKANPPLDEAHGSISATMRSAEPFLTIPTKVTFCFDQPMHQSRIFGQFVYPTQHSKPQEDLHDFTGELLQPYHISQMLDTMSQTISIKRATRRPNLVDYPLPMEVFSRNSVLYDIVRDTIDPNTFELRQNLDIQTSAVTKLRRDRWGSWKTRCTQNACSVLMFQSSPDWSPTADSRLRWTNDEGCLLARSGQGSTSFLHLEVGLELDLVDVLMTSWIATCWYDAIYGDHSTTSPKGSPVLSNNKAYPIARHVSA